MCGICGTAGFADRALLERMTEIITHRGPDDDGVYVSPDGQVGLGNCRLSIIDLSSAGHMPMANDDASVWITYNGEVFNFPALRAELEGLGYRFRSHTDTEVILRGYEAWGIDVVKRLNGMFALALLDRRGGGDSSEPILYLARDRFGVKPLYYSNAGGRLVFGSEIKSMLLANETRRGVNLEALHRYLAFGWVTGPETLFDGILKLPPGTYLRWQSGNVAIQPYWDLRFDVREGGDERELIEELRAVFRRSVERHLISDVPLGVFLSGGLDSSAILAEMARITGKPVSAYTIAYRPEDGILEQSEDDPKYARLVAKHFGADYHEIVVDPDIVDLLPKVVWHLDEPVADAAAIATYLICKAARPQLKVLLSGQGGDEVFAGYRLHMSSRLANLATLLPAPLRDGLARAALSALPRIRDRVPGVRPGLVMAVHRYFDKLLAGAALSPEQRYVFYRSYYTDDAQQQLYSRDLSATLADQVAGVRHLEYFATVPDDDFLNKMLYVDSKTFLPELNLTYSDKLSSAASVETRVPFLDNELIEFAASLPPHLKLRGLNGKYILKKAMEGILPHSVIYRRKAGFGAPIRAWLRRDLHDMVDDLLSEDAIRRRGYFEPAAVRQLVERDRAGLEDNSYRVWALLTLELWHRTFIDASSPHPPAPAPVRGSGAALV